MDTEKEWYKSTILDTRNCTNSLGEEVKEVFMAFRTYDPEGSKTDELGQNYFGWSSKYDAWYGVTDIAIQRPLSATLWYQKVEQSHKIYNRDSSYEDKFDVYFANHSLTKYTSPREKYFIATRTIPDALDSFGH